jgi:sugar lactone lactonase YvrE
VAIDSAGNVYVADTQNSTIRKVTAAGVVTTLAGTAGMLGSADGTGVDARFRNPDGVAVDGAGNVYVADTGNSTIRKITAAAVVTTLAGGAGAAGSIDGTGGDAHCNLPHGVAVDSAGNIYVADTENDTIRKVTATGVVTTLAGEAGMGGSVDGAGAAARFTLPTGVAVDSAGNVFVADRGNATIRKVTAAGVVTTLAGSAGVSGRADGTGSAAQFNNPNGVAVDAAGAVYVADQLNGRIRKISPAGDVTTLAGTAERFSFPSGVAVDSAGHVYVAESFKDIIRVINPAATVTRLAGTASLAGDSNGPGAMARFFTPIAVATDASGNVYVTDAATIRKISPDDVVSTLAGSGIFGSNDGAGAAAQFNSPNGVALDGAGNLYVADQGNQTIRKITATGVVTTFAGTAGERGSADGTGSAARFNFPAGVAVDSAGNVFVADLANSVIRKITPAGDVTTLAGSAGVSGSADGTGSAARFKTVTDVAVDGTGPVTSMSPTSEKRPSAGSRPAGS